MAHQLVDAFEARTGISVLLVGDTEATKTTGLVQRLRAEQNSPRADVFWSSEIFQTIRLAQESHFRTHSGPEADAMLQFLVDLGVPADRVLLEGRSRTTYENARETEQLLAAKGIERVLLVTSALHMRRAEATFRAAGVDVVPAPTDFEVVTERSSTMLDYLPDASALEGSSRAFKEYLGLLVYRWRGWAEW